GESWPDLVTYALSHDWGGLENLSMIPGSVGAAPIQNIGAYGVELKNCFESLRAVHLKTGEAHEFDKEDCAFGYRESCFKNIHKGAYLITEVRLRLTKAGFHQVNLSYGTIEEELEKMGVSTPTIHAVSQAVCRIRTAKLPDPAVVGNAGSFFKNPVIPSGQFEQLQAKYSQVPYYPAESGKIKVPAAWLIDQLGWKGRHIGGAGVHERQALVLVNVGDATGSDLQELAGAIQKDVFENFGISLTPEVNLIPNDLA
ncbi:MAG: UDP-N-acetylmuramate dehydrogenase, partial [Bacteroidota bacterium]